MVDAMFCMISIFIVLLVVLPQEQKKAGFAPQSRVVIRCEGKRYQDMTISVQRALSEETTVALQPNPRERIKTLRIHLNRAIKNEPAPITRVRLVAAGPLALVCLDVFGCAFGIGTSCSMPNVPDRKLEGQFVDFRLGFAAGEADE